MSVFLQPESEATRLQMTLLALRLTAKFQGLPVDVCTKGADKLDLSGGMCEIVNQANEQASGAALRWNNFRIGGGQPDNVGYITIPDEENKFYLHMQLRLSKHDDRRFNFRWFKILPVRMGCFQMLDAPVLVQLIGQKWNFAMDLAQVDNTTLRTRLRDTIREMRAADCFVDNPWVRPGLIVAETMVDPSTGYT